MKNNENQERITIKKVVVYIDPVTGDKTDVEVTLSNDQVVNKEYSEAYLNQIKEYFPAEDIKNVMGTRKEPKAKKTKKSGNAKKTIIRIVAGTLIIAAIVVGCKMCKKGGAQNGQNVDLPAGYTNEIDDSCKHDDDTIIVNIFDNDGKHCDEEKKPAESTKPESTKPAQPTATPQPTDAPKPTATPKPTDAPKPTATPEVKNPDVYFDINNYEEVLIVAKKLKIQLDATKRINLSIEQIVNIILVANNVRPQNFSDCDIAEEVYKPLLAIEQLDVVEAVKEYVNDGVQYPNYIPAKVDITTIFANKKDREYLNVFYDMKNNIIKQIFGNNMTEATRIMKESYLLQCQGIIDNRLLNTRAGNMKYSALSNFAQMQLDTSAFVTNVILGAKEPGYITSYDGDNVSNSLESYKLDAVNLTLQKFANEERKVIADQIYSQTAKTYIKK